jgi:hypothetical protein
LEKRIKLNVLDSKRKNLLPYLKEFKNEFYLAGGTALALQIGHIKSINFDFFSLGKFEVEKLQKNIISILNKYKITIIQLESDTLSVLLNDEIKISFFKVEQDAILTFINAEWFQLCRDLEIAGMKMIALLRAAYRDYVDMFFLLKKYKLADIILFCERKYPGFEKSVYLKALLSFEDIELTPIRYIAGKEKKSEEIFSFIKKQTKVYLTHNC